VEVGVVVLHLFELELIKGLDHEVEIIGQIYLLLLWSHEVGHGHPFDEGKGLIKKHHEPLPKHVVLLSQLDNLLQAEEPAQEHEAADRRCRV